MPMMPVLRVVWVAVISESTGAVFSVIPLKLFIECLVSARNYVKLSLFLSLHFQQPSGVDAIPLLQARKLRGGIICLKSYTVNGKAKTEVCLTLGLSWLLLSTAQVNKKY